MSEQRLYKVVASDQEDNTFYKQFVDKEEAKKQAKALATMYHGLFNVQDSEGRVVYGISR